MKRSAAWSSWSVVTPGRTLPASRSMVRTRMSPARAILSISAGVFLMIIGGSESLFEPQRREGGPDVVVDLGGAARAVEAPQQALLLVVVDQRLGLLMVRREPLLDHLRLVVLAQLEGAAAEVAHALGLRGVERHVLDVAVRALAAAGQPLDDDLVGRRDVQRRGQPPAELVELLLERLRLRVVAREAVEQEAVVALGLDLAEDHRDHQLVGHELALVHVRRRLAAELGLLRDVLAQQVAGRDVREVEVLAQPRRLRAFTGPRRTQQDQVELRHKPRRLL